ncbi:universal stress protein [Ammoniphilus sp. YIM 78166]|uniref:universal stress protein n=1 Tax=Ammoniphilus sp. YIM 78166 TaxID=1644106 RepID=UPI00106F2DCF|nr:universal stress protein [Ammoniphilus sp. YIM 78166]
MMIASRILVAFDGSLLSELSLRKATQLASTDSLIEVHVIHIGTYRIYMKEFQLAGEMSPTLRLPVIEHGEGIIRKAEELLRGMPNPHQIFLVKGDPGRAIINHAKQYNCDLIVIGNRGMGRWKSYLLGSVSQYVIRHALVPVFIMKMKQ